MLEFLCLPEKAFLHRPPGHKEDRMIKKRIAALVLFALFLLSGGCSLIEVDEELALKKENEKVIIEYRGEKITKEDVTLKMKAELSKQQLNLDDIKENESYWPSYLEGFIKRTAAFRIAMDKADELGLSSLSEEEAAQLDAQYQEGLETADSSIGFYVQTAVDADPALDYDEEYAAWLEDYLNSIGYSAATYRQQLEREYIFDKVKEHYISGLEVSEEEVRSYYDTNVEVQKSNLELNPAFFEMQRGFGQVFYYPEGYMYVRHILLKFDFEDSLDIYQAESAGNVPLYDSLISEASLSIQPKVDELMSRLDAGEDFDALMEEYNEDPAFNEEPLKTKGHVIGPASQIDIPGYVEAATALTQAGQYSKPVFGMMGAYIIRCERLLKGAIPYDEMKESIRETLLTSRREAKWSELTNEWIDAATADGTLKMFVSRY